MASRMMIRLNGQPARADVESATPLLYALHTASAQASAFLMARAAERLGVGAAQLQQWPAPTMAFPADYDALSDILLTAPAKGPAKVDRSNGDVDTALAAAAKRIKANYEYPFQPHACARPACALAQITPEQVMVWMGAASTA